MKKLLKSLIPPILLHIFQKYKNKKYGWKGDYSTWQQAKNDSTGYDSDEILLAVKTSLLKVKNGVAVYERDSVIFDEIQYSWPLLSGILLASVKSGSVNVLDFGGSLGSTYYQNKRFLDAIENVSWSVVEQAGFVDIGKKEFEDERLKFFFNSDECIKKEQPNVLLLASVLQYIESPYDFLDEILQYDFEYIVLDRTLFNLHNKDRITLQVVPPSIYEASYPCWFFDKTYLINYFFTKNYSIVEYFNGEDASNMSCILSGMIFKKDD